MSPLDITTINDLQIHIRGQIGRGRRKGVQGEKNIRSTVAGSPERMASFSSTESFHLVDC